MYDPVGDLAKEMLLSEMCRYIEQAEMYHVHTSDICAKLDSAPGGVVGGVFPRCQG